MATKYLRGAGTGVWNTDASWSTTSSAGAANTTKPVAADAVILDSGSGSVCTIDTVNQACTSIVCTGYTGALTFTTLNLTTTGTITLVAGMTVNVGTTAIWYIGCAAVAFTPGGKILGNVNFNVTGTLTVTGGAATIGSVTISAGVTVTLATNGITVKGILDTGSTGIITGLTVTMDGSGTTPTWQATGWTTGYCASNLTVTGAITISGNVGFRTGTLTTSGAFTITWSSGVVNIGASCTFTDSTVGQTNTWANGAQINCTATASLTLSTAFTIYHITGAAAILTLVTSVLTVKGNITTSGTGGIAGTAITMSGAIGSATLAAAGTGAIANNLTITAAMIFSGNIYYKTGVLTTSGAFTITWSSATFYVAGSMTLTDSTAGQTNTWAAGTINCSATASLTLSQATTFAHISGATAILTFVTSAVTVKGNITTSGAGGIAGTAITANGTIGSATLAAAGTGAIANNLTFTGNVIVSGVNYYKTGVLTYTSGTITTTSSTLNIAGNCTLAINGISWNAITISATATATLSNALTSTGILTISAALTFSGAYLVTVGSISQGAFTLTLSNAMTCTGNYTNTGASVIAGSFTVSIGGIMNLAYALSGAATIALTVGSTWSASSATCTLSNKLTFNGNSTISGSVYYNGSTFTYSSGTVTTTSSSVYFSGTVSLVAISSITFNSLVFMAAGTVATDTTVTSDDSINCANFSMYCLSQLTLAATKNITVSSTIALINCTILSGTPSSPITLTYQGTEDNSKCALATLTDINSTNAFWVWFPTLLRTTNINSVTRQTNSIFKGSVLAGEVD